MTENPTRETHRDGGFINNFESSFAERKVKIACLQGGGRHASASSSQDAQLQSRCIRLPTDQRLWWGDDAKKRNVWRGGEVHSEEGWAKDCL